MNRNRIKIHWNKPKTDSGLEIFQSIVEAARLQFSKSYAATTTNHIAEYAGVSIASLYRYFENKESILTYLVEEFIQETKKETSRVARATNEKDFQRWILEVTKPGIDRYIANAGFLKTMYQYGGELGLTEKIFKIRLDIADDLSIIVMEKFEVSISREQLKEQILTSINAFMGVVQGHVMTGSPLQASVLSNLESPNIQHVKEKPSLVDTK